MTAPRPWKVPMEPDPAPTTGSAEDAIWQRWQQLMRDRRDGALSESDYHRQTAQLRRELDGMDTAVDGPRPAPSWGTEVLESPPRRRRLPRNAAPWLIGGALVFCLAAGTGAWFAAHSGDDGTAQAAGRLPANGQPLPGRPPQFQPPQQQGTQQAGSARLGVEGRDSAQGALVVQVEPGSAADHAGINSGDVIIRLDRRRIDSMAALADAVSAHAPGDLVQLELLRGGQRLTVPVRLGSA